MNPRIESLDDEAIVSTIKIAMSEGCIVPCHVYDAVEELIRRFEDLKVKRNLH